MLDVTVSPSAAPTPLPGVGAVRCCLILLAQRRVSDDEGAVRGVGVAGLFCQPLRFPCEAFESVDLLLRPAAQGGVPLGSLLQVDTRAVQFVLDLLAHGALDVRRIPGERGTTLDQGLRADDQGVLVDADSIEHRVVYALDLGLFRDGVRVGLFPSMDAVDLGVRGDGRGVVDTGMLGSDPARRALGQDADAVARTAAFVDSLKGRGEVPLRGVEFGPQLFGSAAVVLSAKAQHARCVWSAVGGVGGGLDGHRSSFWVERSRRRPRVLVGRRV